MKWSHAVGRLSSSLVRTTLFAVTTIGLSAFGNLVDAEAQSQAITILTGGDAAYTPLFVAGDKGYFKNEGVDVSIRMFPSGTDAMLAFRAVGAPFVAAGDVPSLVLWEGDDVVGIAPFYATPDNLLGVVRADIKNAADLKGKKIATRKGSTAEYFLTTYLTKNGVNPADVNIINLGPEENAPALLAGNIDGFFIWGPYPALALKIMGDKARVLTTARGYYLEQLYLTANRKFAQGNPDTVVKILKAIHTANGYIRTNPNDSAEIAARRTKGAVDVVSSVIQIKPFSLRYGPENREQLSKLIEFLRSSGKLKTPVSIDQALDTRYLKSVDAGLVSQ
jgi:ABC-type nitrate/sulfonate/bicarbonate transport system substrate-binding protein